MSDGPSEVDLPFGVTQTTPPDLEKYVNREVARDILRANGVRNQNHHITTFVEQVPALLRWLETNGRLFPWRETSDPWRVYISEILLQRTRAVAVADLYESFFAQFPDPESLSDASDSAIHDSVAPLGFGNHRTRTLKEVAVLLVTEHEGKVPRSLEELQRPWRVGPYSARATMLFAFGEPLALIDTNIARIIERVFGYEMPAQPHKSDRVYQLMGALVPETPGLCRSFNLALLDLGNAICTPEQPSCPDCPLRQGCKFYNT